MTLPTVARGDQLIVPTGDEAVDARAIRLAARTGGVIMLRARDAMGTARPFNFGADQTAFFRVDTTVIGETDGDAMTTISGGAMPFYVLCKRWEARSCAEAPRFVVRGVHFDGAVYAAVTLAAANHAEIADNKFTNLRGGPMGGYTKGQAVWVGGAQYPWYPPQNVRGRLIITNNAIVNVSADLGYGIALVNFGAETEIRGNTIRGVGNAGIGAFAWSGTLTIEDNTIEPGHDATALYSMGAGMWLSQGESGYGGTAGVHTNSIRCSHPDALGIALGGGLEDAVVSGNRVAMDSGFTGLAVIAGSRITVRNNAVEGDGTFALAIFGWPWLGAVGNHFAGNNIVRFAAGAADVYLDEFAADNDLRGYSGTVVDLGARNRVTGLTPMPKTRMEAPRISGLAATLRLAKPLRSETAPALDEVEYRTESR